MRVLLIDDDGVARRRIHQVIEEARRDAEVVACLHAAASTHTLVRSFDVIAANLCALSRPPFALVRGLRQRGDPTPFVAYCACLQSDDDRSAAIRAGVTLTFESPLALPKTFCAQLETLAQTPSTPSGGVLQVGEIVVDTRSRLVTVRGSPVHLTRQDYDLLLALARSASVTLSRGKLAEILGQRYGASSHAIQIAISRLRKKLGTAGAQLVTEYGAGVRLEATPPPAKSAVRLAKVRPVEPLLQRA